MGLYENVWSDGLWFSNTSEDGSLGWQEFGSKSGSENYFPRTFDLVWSLPIGVMLILLRRVLQRGPLIKLGYYLGVPNEKVDKVEENDCLEAAYTNNSKLDKWNLERLSKQTDMSKRQIEIWFRKRARLDKLTDIQRFTESSWHLLIRGSSFIVGLFLLSSKPWFWDTKYAWIDWPRHPVSNGVFYYYIQELSIYWHFIFNLLTDSKRKDFWLSAVHHVCTIVLIYFGWILNFVRIGSLVLLVHDASDPWVDLGKILVYSKRKRLSEIVFVIFVFVWMSTKDGIYPFMLLYSTTFEAYQYLPVTPFMIIFFNIFLYILMILHLGWTYIVFNVIITKLKHGELKDVRSDSEKDNDSD